MIGCRALALALAMCLLMPCAAMAEAAADGSPGYDWIVELLGDGRIAETYAHLEAGAMIARGDKDPKLQGLQVLLNLLGGSLNVDGSIGEKSFEQLRRAQAAYGLTQGEPVSAADYDALLVQAYLVADPAAALSALGPDFEARIRYARAAQHEMKGEYDSARALFEGLADFKDAEARAAACAQPWPADGPVIRDSGYAAEDCQLTVKTSRDAAQATYFKLFDGEVLVLSLFIAGSGEATVNLPKGTYTCKAGVGTDWYGPKEAFGRGGGALYQKLTFEGGAGAATMRKDRRYTLMLGGASENNVGTEDEDAETF